MHSDAPVCSRRRALDLRHLDEIKLAHYHVLLGEHAEARRRLHRVADKLLLDKAHHELTSRVCGLLRGGNVVPANYELRQLVLFCQECLRSGSR
jgi:hypothetical protein